MFSTRCLVAALAVPALLVLCGAAVAQTPAADAVPARSLAAAKSWGYQLQKIDPDALAAAPYDVLVIDYSRDGSDARALTAAEVGKLKIGPDGRRRIVLAYLSIGEAEKYRYYWQPDWETSTLAPPWLAEANKRYRTNFLVRYWHEDWQAIIFRGENSYLGRILNAGFDGIYLDRVDMHQEFENENPAAGEQMIAFVKALAAHARALKPGFLVVPQNAEELLTDPGYRAVIDGLAKEDLLFGEVRAKRPNRPDQIETHVAPPEAHDRRAQAGLRRGIHRRPAGYRARQDACSRSYGFIPHFANRALNRMRIGDLPEPPAKPGRSSRRLRIVRSRPPLPPSFCCIAPKCVAAGFPDISLPPGGAGAK